MFDTSGTEKPREASVPPGPASPPGVPSNGGGDSSAADHNERRIEELKETIRDQKETIASLLQLLNRQHDDYAALARRLSSPKEGDA